MFPAVPAAPFARYVVCCGILVIYFTVFKICDVLLSFLTLYFDVTIRGSDKPACHGGAKVRYGYLRSMTIISTFYYGLLHSEAVSCVLTKA